jgi:hypothetical protein
MEQQNTEVKNMAKPGLYSKKNFIDSSWIRG